MTKLTDHQRRLVREIVELTPAAADPRAIPVDALVKPDAQALPTVYAVPTPANDDEGQP
jgi:hypothetical protein